MLLKVSPRTAKVRAKIKERAKARKYLISEKSAASSWQSGPLLIGKKGKATSANKAAKAGRSELWLWVFFVAVYV